VWITPGVEGDSYQVEGLHLMRIGHGDGSAWLLDSGSSLNRSHGGDSIQEPTGTVVGI
jgi:hypothetical protein